MKQHYIPQFYLKNFSEKNKNSYLINVFDKEKEDAFKSNINSIGCEHNFYGIDSTDRKNFEKLLSEFEANFAKSLNEVLKKRSIKHISEDTKTLIA